MATPCPLDMSPFGMGIYPSHRTSGEETARAVQLAKNAGITWTRDEIGWAGLQPEKDRWEWAKFDHGVNACVENGIEVMGLLAYSAPWATTLHDAQGNPVATAMPDLAAWREYVAAVVERYKDRVHVWQLWNEPNIQHFWKPDPNPHDYARLLIAGAEAAKAVDPSCWIVGCNTSLVDLKFDRAVFEAGAWDHIDVVGVHPYRYPHTPEHTDLTGELLGLADLCSEFGSVKPIWISEIGYATHLGQGGSSEWWAAAMLVRFYLTAWSSRLVQKLFWYDFRNDGDDPLYNESNFGILNRDWTPKLSFEAFKVMANTLAGFAPDGRVDLGEDVRVYRYAREHDIRYVAWTTGTNRSVPVPAPSERVLVVKPLGEKLRHYAPGAPTIEAVTETEIEAPNGWARVALDAMPLFILPVTA